MLPLRMIRALLAKSVQLRCSGLHKHIIPGNRPLQHVCFSTANEKRSNEQDSSTSTSPFVLRSVYDNSSNWEDWFTPEEYGHPYEVYASKSITGANTTDAPRSPMILESLDGDPGLDASSRHLIRSLQTGYLDGYFKETITTQSCQAMIHRLLTSADDISNADPTGVESAMQARQRVIRSEAILRTMELFWDLVPDLIEDTNPQKRFLRKSNPNSRPVVEFPLPTFHIYSSLLMKLANLRAPKLSQKQVNFADIPWITQDVVLRLHRFHRVKGVKYLKEPTIVEWNQALLAWANAHGSRDHPEKSVYATQFFMDMTLQYKVRPDVSSHSHVLRACAHPDKNEKAKLLGFQVAIKFWNGVVDDALEEQSISAKPYLFVFFMRALSHHREPIEGESYIKKAWERACEAGVVNEHVLYELEKSSPRLYEEFVGAYRSGAKSDNNSKVDKKMGSYDKSTYKELMPRLPSDWTKNAERDNTQSH